MLRKTLNRASLVLMLMFAGTVLFAQDGAFSSYAPYSIFGVGNLASPGSAYNRSMGGVGIATRNHRYLNTVNPAAITERDSLSFMLDFSLENVNTIYQQNYGGVNRKTVNNITNITGFAISFPIWRRSVAMALGMRPYSSTGYSFKSSEGNASVLATTGPISYSLLGQGSLYTLFASAAVRPIKRLSFGAEFDYIFGGIDKELSQTFTYSGFNKVSETYNLVLTSVTGKFGVQYEQPIGKKSKLGFGATYRLASHLNGYIDYQNEAVGSAESIVVKEVSDTLNVKSTIVKLGDELGLGISYSFGEKFRAEFNYIRTNWKNSGMDLVDGFSTANAVMVSAPTVGQSFRLGMEYTPNINDVRYYYKKVAYRAGAYYNKEYFTVAGYPIGAMGITLGATLPVFRWYNGLTVGMELGQRGTLNNGLIRERYLKFSFGVNLFDIWFQKPRYE